MEDSPGGGAIATGEASPPRPTLASTSRVEIERECLRGALLSQQVIRTIEASRRQSTNRIYNATWVTFVSWCQAAHVNPSRATVPQVLDFLQEGLDKGLSLATVRRQLAALATVLPGEASTPLPRLPLVKRFLKGAAHLRPPPVHRFPTWHLPTVLRALMAEPFEPLRTVSRKLLTCKVVFLVAITSARRVSELGALSSREDLCSFHNNRVVLRLDPTFLPKVNSVFHRAQEVILPDFCPDPVRELEHKWHRLDVRRALRIYLRRTAEFRRSEALFISFQPSSLGKRVSPSTISRWIRLAISLAYEAQNLPVPAGITAHSTRSAATSAAWASQAPIEDICRAATWASSSPFIRHYRLDAFASSDAAFGRRVLQQVRADQ